MRARRRLLLGAFALSAPAVALAVGMVIALADSSPVPTPGGSSPAPASPAPGSTPSASSSALGGGLPGDPQNGATLYGQNCATCHGADMTGGIGPRLNPVSHLGNTSNPLDPTYLITTITNGLKNVGCPSGTFNCSAGEMPAKGGASINDQDIKDIAAYIIQQNKLPGQQALDPRALAVENVKWVTIGILAMLILTFLLARYNMRWIDRRVAARRERIERQGQGRP
jgi:mono/diheme cytochrome c family protein